MAKLRPLDFTRQLGIFDPSKYPSVHVTVVGAGGIGGPTTLALAKLGIRNLTVHDFDRVDPHNQPNQMYGPEEVGMKKVYALANLVKRQTGVQLKTYSRKVTDATKFEGVVIGAVDSMDARRAIWSAVKAAGRKVPLYIDGRLGEQVIRVLTVRTASPRERSAYEESIVPIHAVAPLRCTHAGIIDVSFAVASLITRALRMALTNPKEVTPDIYYDHRNLGFLRMR